MNFPLPSPSIEGYLPQGEVGYVAARLPFIFWAALSIAPLVTLFFTKETGWRRIKNLSSID